MSGRAGERARGACRRAGARGAQVSVSGACRNGAQARRGARSAGGQAAAREAGAGVRGALGVGARGARSGRACARRLGVLAGQLG